jgi:hypothetical protein
MTMMSMCRWPRLLMAAAAALLMAASPALRAQSAQALHSRHASLQPALAKSPFKRPLVLQAGGSADRPNGDVYAVVEHPFGRVGGALRSAANWCDMLMLQLNIKRCHPTGLPPHETLHVGLGRKADQPVKDAIPLDFDYTVQAAEPDYFSVQMSSADGPFGTRDYRLTLEAVPLDGSHTFVHMAYTYASGFAARVATEAYLATAGRHKVGFTIVGRDRDGRPIYVKGIQGVAERNTMRYFLAVDAFLDSLTVPGPQQADKRLRDWFAETERYPLQLHEMDFNDYLAMKRREM